MSIPKIFGDKEYFTVSHAARQLSMSPATIRRWCDVGHLDSIVHPVNHYRFVSRESIDNLRGSLEAQLTSD